MLLFRVLWGFDLVAATIALALFAIGIADGSVSSFNIVLWIALLAGLALVVFGSRALRERGRNGLAIALAGVLAVPVILFGVLFGAVMFSGARWN
jgi:hypothetical protein